MRRTHKIASTVAAVLVIPLASVLFLLCFPQPLFAYATSVGELTLYSDAPFAQQDGVAVLQIAAQKLATSPLYLGEQSHAIYICNESWRQRLFFTYTYGAGGVNYYPLTTNVFLRKADVKSNRLYKRDGSLVDADRPLDYYIVHEITHTLAKRKVGIMAHERLPQWIREGYPDYVGKGSQFDYDAAVRALIAGDETMNYEKSGLYLRFHLLVAHLMDKENWTVDRVLTESISQADVENRVLALAASETQTAK